MAHRPALAALALLAGCTAPPPAAPVVAPADVAPMAEPPAAERRAPVPRPAAPAPTPRHPFEHLQAGMTVRQVVDRLGPPTARHTHAGRSPAAVPAAGASPRTELHYAGRGRLEFAGGPPGDPDAARLVHIVPDAR